MAWRVNDSQRRQGPDRRRLDQAPVRQRRSLDARVAACEWGMSFFRGLSRQLGSTIGCRAARSLSFRVDERNTHYRGNSLCRSCLTSRSSSVALRSDRPDSSFHRLFSPVSLLSYHTINVFASAYIVVLSARTTASALLAHTFKLRVSPPLLRNLKARTAFRDFRYANHPDGVFATRHRYLKIYRPFHRQL